MGPSARMTDAVLRKKQAGFRKHRDCTDQIFALRNIIEQRTEWQRQLYVNFVDFEKAFNSVHPDNFWNILRHYYIPSKLVHLIKSFYNNFRCSVEHKNIFINLDFADDPVLLSHTHHHIQEKTNRLQTNRQQVGLRISKKKTETMTAWKRLFILKSEMKNYTRQTTSHTWVASQHKRAVQRRTYTADWTRLGEYLGTWTTSGGLHNTAPGPSWSFPRALLCPHSYIDQGVGELQRQISPNYIIPHAMLAQST